MATRLFVASGVGPYTIPADGDIVIAEAGTRFFADINQTAISSDDDGHQILLYNSRVYGGSGIVIENPSNPSQSIGRNLIDVDADSFIRSFSNNAIRISGSDNLVRNSGIIEAPGLNTVSGSAAIRLETDSRVYNTGDISGLYGVQAMDSFSGVRVDNFGQIDGTGSGLLFQGHADGYVANFANITGGAYGLEAGNTQGAITLINTGTIAGGSGSVFITNITGSPTFGHSIVNKGLMIGDVSLSEGNDRYDGRGGEVVGDILGGGGADRLIGGASDDILDGGSGADEINGGAGNDLIRGGDSDGVNNQFLRGDDGNDKIVGGETRDIINGGNDDDELIGFGGNDFLIGGRGEDLFRGGFGNDAIRGGAGDEDTAQYDGALADYTVFIGSDGKLRVRDEDLSNGNEGTDNMTGIEFLEFTDGTFAVDDLLAA